MQTTLHHTTQKRKNNAVVSTITAVVVLAILSSLSLEISTNYTSYTNRRRIVEGEEITMIVK